MSRAATLAAAASSASASAHDLSVASASSLAALSLDTVCHCLMLDAQHLAADPAAAALLISAFACSDSTTLVTLLCTSLPLVRADVSTAITEPTHRRVHMHFVSASARSRALLASPMLLQCNAVHPQWGIGEAQQCGPKRHELRELLQLSSTLAASIDVAAAHTAIRSMLTANNIDATTFWLSNKTRFTPTRPNAPRMTINVLPRDISDTALANAVNTLQAGCKLFDRQWMVHAPNMPTLTRCRECNELGHSTDRCVKYECAAALRLLFKQAMPFSLLTQLIESIGARDGYLGATLEERAPSTKITLLFDGADDDSNWSNIAERMAMVHASISDKLLSMTQVDTRKRTSECKLCNNHNGIHTCELERLATGGASRHSYANRASPQSGGSGAAMHSAGRSSVSQGRDRSAASSAVAASVDVNDKMCRNWRSHKSCRRLNEGRACMYEHPLEHVPAQARCFDFTQGRCTRGARCRFTHSAVEQAVQPQQHAAASVKSAVVHAGSALPRASQSDVVVQDAAPAPTFNPNEAAAASAYAPASSVASAACGARAAPAPAIVAVAAQSQSNKHKAASSKKKQQAAAAAAARSAHSLSARAAIDVTDEVGLTPATPSKKRRMADGTAAAAGAAAESSSGSNSKRANKTASRNLDAAFTHSTNRFADLNADAMEEGEVLDEQEKGDENQKTVEPPPAAKQPVPFSSLSSMPSPARFDTPNLAQMMRAHSKVLQTAAATASSALDTSGAQPARSPSTSKVAKQSTAAAASPSRAHSQTRSAARDTAAAANSATAVTDAAALSPHSTHSGLSGR